MTASELYQKELAEAIEHLQPKTTREFRHCEFIAKWESYFPQMTKEEMAMNLDRTSPHHPDENMVWLYDRLLVKMSGVEEAK